MADIYLKHSATGWVNVLNNTLAPDSFEAERKWVETFLTPPPCFTDLFPEEFLTRDLPFDPSLTLGRICTRCDLREEDAGVRCEVFDNGLLEYDFHLWADA